MDTVYRHAALADGSRPDLELDQSIVVVGDRIQWMGPDDAMGEPPGHARVIDAGGATVVPGMVDAHSHTVLPGGSHWIARIDDPTEELLQVAEDNGALAHRAGVRWFRDVGSPQRDGKALAIRVRDAWHGRRDRPYLRAAGTWIARSGVLPPTVDIEANDVDELVAAVEQQAMDGADLIKLYMDGPDPDTSPWTADEVGRAVAAAASHGLAITAHAGTFPGTRAAVMGGVDCIEHGFAIDEEVAAAMAERGTFMVSTLGVFSSWETFGSTTTIDRFTEAERRKAIAARKDVAFESLGRAARAGVRIAAGTDFGGGSLRANHLAWEVEAQVAAGREPWQALASATRVGGDLLREPHAGRLSVGGPADFFLVHGNPLDDPAALWRVWKVA